MFGVNEKNISIDLIRQMQSATQPGKGTASNFPSESKNKTSEEKAELRTKRANGQ